MFTIYIEKGRFSTEISGVMIEASNLDKLLDIVESLGI